MGALKLKLRGAADKLLPLTAAANPALYIFTVTGEKRIMAHRAENAIGMKEHSNRESIIRKLKLVGYDIIVIAIACWLILAVNPVKSVALTGGQLCMNFLMAALCIIGSRKACKIYSQVWRYSRSSSYMKLICADAIGGALYLLLACIMPIARPDIMAMMMVCMTSLIGSMLLRYMYIWVFEISQTNAKLMAYVKRRSVAARCINSVVHFITGIDLINEANINAMPDVNKIKIAIIGAGRIGAMLADELLNNPNAVYAPVCFVDIDKEKVGRQIMGINVLEGGEDTKENLNRLAVHEVVFAMEKTSEERTRLFEQYKAMGFKVKVYTFPMENSLESGRRQIREFDVEELLCRHEIDFIGEDTLKFYRDKVVMVTGGGGSIGSELSRQIAKMRPRQLVLLDIYENNVYDVQQELKLAYQGTLNLAVEIASVRDKAQIEKVFKTYRPQIVLHAAAHKHVPLMEHNCSEAIKNNVFGTWNVVNAAEKYGAEKFIMISTDKAVNPTNVMGASKRMCEMLVLSRAAEHSHTSFSCTRFGNVLGSNGSVIPLFKRQIANGGPITLTDRRIIRYFMTIPEASQLVLQSGAMAKNGELYVLDMGNPVKILELAENMIRLSGYVPYKDIDIIETGLRPGEKLYEELLIRDENLDKTENSLIFVERDNPQDADTIATKLEILREALKSGDDMVIKNALKRVVKTFHDPEEVNKEAKSAAEMNMVYGDGKSKAESMAV